MDALRQLPIVMWLAALLAWPATAGTYSHRELGFRVRLPDGYEDVSRRMPLEGAFITVAQFDPRGTALRRLVSLQDLGGVIRQDNDLSKTRKRPGNVKLEKARWRSFTIDVFKVTEVDNGAAYVALNAQVPLMPRGLQVTVSGPAAEEPEVRRELETLLATVEGPSNWTTPRERLARSDSGTTRAVLILAALVIGSSFLLWRVFR